MSEHRKCDLCDGRCHEGDGPPEVMDLPRSEYSVYGRYSLIVKQRFWHGLPFGYRTKRLDVCRKCMGAMLKTILDGPQEVKQ